MMTEAKNGDVYSDKELWFVKIYLPFIHVRLLLAQG